ncbi:hypothetical protein BN946_scf184996.g1, partial [Trametes cinnabarina]
PPTTPLFSFLAAPPPAEQPSAPRASHIDPKKYPMESKDFKFRAALHKFRRAETLKTYGRPILNTLGPGLIMGNETLTRISDCARARKLNSLEDLQRESKWHLSQKLGARVLELIVRFYPPQEPGGPLTSSIRANQHPSDGQGPRQMAPRRCGVCSQLGHTKRSKNCPRAKRPAPTLLNEETVDATTLATSTNTALLPASPPTSATTAAVHCTDTQQGSMSGHARVRSYDNFWSQSLFAEPSYQRREVTMAELLGMAPLTKSHPQR